MTAFGTLAYGTMPWRPLVSMGDGTGGYDSPRMPGGELDAFSGHKLMRDHFGELYDHGPHGIFGVKRVPDETDDETIRRWRDGVERGWYGR